MSVKSTKETPVKKGLVNGQAKQELFGKENFIWMLAGLIILTVGFILMAGGKSADPKVFDTKEVYSPMRITVAPILIVIGFIVEIFAIMRKSKTEA